MELGLSGRRALVLGGNRGMGLAIATSLAAEGADIAIAARDLDRLEQARAGLAAAGARALAFPLDLADSAGLAGFAARLAGEFGAPEILVNNTGGPPYGTAGGRSLADWQGSFTAMTLSVIALHRRLPAGDARGRMGAHRHRGVVGRGAAGAGAGHLQHIARRPGRLVEDSVRRGRGAWHHRQRAGPRPDCDRAGCI